MGSGLPLGDAVLEHEIGHALCNASHSAAQSWQFFPTTGLLMSDSTSIDGARRLPQSTEAQCRTDDRPLVDLQANGNIMLVTP